LYPTAGSAESTGAVQVRLTEAEMPVPLKPITVLVEPLELLVSVKTPGELPFTVGSNCTLRVAVLPGLRESGNVTPDIE